ncbi:MAG: hypothetical protein B6242_09345 [Anaerolineaceae bacterium 4572_78]|nr:MAG: hypothetical protein B6242_09345 [Anaerolineaceae bacterium 4572_78]
MTWNKYLTDYNEGLGVVYERFILNDYLLGVADKYNIQTVLEAPLYGMAGVSGINSYCLAKSGRNITLIDDNAERLKGVQQIWAELDTSVNVIYHADYVNLPFDDNTFDLAWEWAGLWYLPDAKSLLQELARVSRKLVFIAMPNNWQVGYLLRKYVIDQQFFQTIDERWVNMSLIKNVLQSEGVTFVDEGVLDVPPWPDTVMPAAEVLKRLGIRSKALNERFTGEGWQWSTMAYYLNEQPSLHEEVMKYAWLDHAPLPWQIKLVWAHHHYVLGTVG